jgi:hypothetical protein
MRAPERQRWTLAHAQPPEFTLSRSQEQKPRLCQRGSLAGDFEGIGLEPKGTSARRMGGRVAREEEKMKRASRGLTGLLVIAWVVAPLGATAQLQRPNISDIAICNEEALAKAGTPSASPGPPPTVPPGPRSEPPGAPADTPTLAPKPGTQTDPSGSIVVQSPDPLLEGMGTEGLDDRTYRTAYRDCMAGRLRPGR